jgi:6-phosphogluconolactonase
VRTIRATDSADLAVRAGAALGALISSAIGERGICAVAVSGGTTPGLMFAELARFGPDWDRVHLFQVDERVAPDGDTTRNLTDLEHDLLAKVPLPRANLHVMPVGADDLQAGAAAYGGEIEAACGGVFDVVHLGLGDDGHTASWPPGDPVIDVTDRDVAVVGPYRDRVRMTLTLPVVNRARTVLWLVSGAAKVPALTQLLTGGTIPACRVDQRRSLLLADAAALGPSGPGAG